jgi:DNA-binding transcriptional LysR family regulator
VFATNGKVLAMADLDNILIFVKVAQFGSISPAARSLGMPISTVSRRLSVLESELGVSFLRRTTRRVTLTAQGREYFNECQEPLILLQEAELRVPEGSCADPDRPVHHESLPRSGCRKH